MLSYQHIYHAGNKADLHKHLWLITVLDYLRQKNKPFTWIDTHAGRGLYNLQSKEAQKLGEYKEGFLNLPLPTQHEPQPLALYRTLIKDANADKKQCYYPGSALIAARMLRPADTLWAFDLHPQESKHLKNNVSQYQFVKTQQADGLERLGALMPPPARRGGALIDPSYEIKKEYDTVGNIIKKTLKKFPAGIYMIWYPLLAAGLHENLKNKCAALAPAPLIDEWIWAAPDTKGMYGSGMIIFNPPYTAAETMEKIQKICLGKNRKTGLKQKSQ